MNDEFFACLRHNWDRPFNEKSNKGFLLVTDLTPAEAAVALKQQLRAHGLPTDGRAFAGIMMCFHGRSDDHAYSMFMAASYDTPWGPKDFTVVILSRAVIQRLGIPPWLETWSHPCERAPPRAML